MYYVEPNIPEISLADCESVFAEIDTPPTRMSSAYEQNMRGRIPSAQQGALRTGASHRSTSSSNIFRDF